MRKPSFGLFGKIVVAILGGIALGWLLGHPWVPCAWGLKAAAVFSDLVGQLLKFIVPLLILGLVTPAIAEMGGGAGKMLLVVLAMAYGSTVFAGYLSYFASAAVFPSILGGALQNLDAVHAAKPFLVIQPVMPVLTALALSFLLGLGIAFTKAEMLRRVFDELRTIISRTIERVVMPLLPFYIMAMIAKMGAEGSLVAFGVIALKIIGMSVVLTLSLLAIQYGVACAVARRNPFVAIWNMLPAYFTGLTICSSAATIPVAMGCSRKNGVSEDTTAFVVPLCATIHLAGSMTKIVSCAVAFMVLAGRPLDFGVFSTFIFMMSVTAVAAPGVAGGVITSSQGMLLAVLAFTPEQVGLLTTVYLAMDGLGTACNVTGDGAIALVVDRFFGPRGTVHERQAQA